MVSMQVFYPSNKKQIDTVPKLSLNFQSHLFSKKSVYYNHCLKTRFKKLKAIIHTFKNHTFFFQKLCYTRWRKYVSLKAISERKNNVNF